MKKMRKDVLQAGGMICVFLLLISAAATARAGRSWTLQGAGDFSKGELDGVSVLSTGELTLSPSVQALKGLEANFVWDIQSGDDGRILVASGAPGAAYEVRGDEVRLRYRTSEEHALSILPMPDGSILLGTAPRGIIYRIAQDDTVTVFADLDASYVWDMARSDDGRIYCATGPDGRLVRLTPEGEPSVAFAAPRPMNLLSLAMDAARGSIYVGTQPGGIVYEVKGDDDYTVLFDAPEDEIRDMVLCGDGVLYAGTARSEQAPGEARREREPDGAPRIRAPERDGSEELLPGRPAASNSVYRIDPGTGAYKLAGFEEALVLAVSCWKDHDEVLAGTGVDGRLIGIGTDGRTRVVAETGAMHVSALNATDDGRVVIGTSNPGQLMLMDPADREEGTYTSHVFDADYLSRWGTVRWMGSGADDTGSAVYVRTGNSREPDRTWSAWTGPAGEGRGERLELPMGRFAQVRVTLTSGDGETTPEVNQITLHYRQANRRPVIERLEVNGENQRRGREERHALPEKTVTWSASDPNRDELEYSLCYRGVDERDWRKLAAGLREETSFTWDTARVPDGYYLVRLIATDRPSRGATEALQDEKVAGPFLVDNGPPAISDLDYRERQIAGHYIITGVASDRASNISSIQVSHNSGDWQPVFPDDGLFDSGEEPFTFSTSELEEGQHVFVIIAEDAAGNTGSGKIIIDIGAQ